MRKPDALQILKAKAWAAEFLIGTGLLLRRQRATRSNGKSETSWSQLAPRNLSAMSSTLSLLSLGCRELSRGLLVRHTPRTRESPAYSSN